MTTASTAMIHFRMEKRQVSWEKEMRFSFDTFCYSYVACEGRRRRALYEKRMNENSLTWSEWIAHKHMLAEWQWFAIRIENNYRKVRSSIRCDRGSEKKKNKNKSRGLRIRSVDYSLGRLHKLFILRCADSNEVDLYRCERCRDTILLFLVSREATATAAVYSKCSQSIFAFVPTWKWLKQHTNNEFLWMNRELCPQFIRHRHHSASVYCAKLNPFSHCCRSWKRRAECEKHKNIMRW